jgi:hypothetical protein
MEYLKHYKIWAIIFSIISFLNRSNTYATSYKHGLPNAPNASEITPVSQQNHKLNEDEIFFPLTYLGKKNIFSHNWEHC